MTTLPFQLDIVSPEQMVFSDTVYGVEIPGAEGDFGVLAGHAPVLSAIRAGVIRIDCGAEGKKAYFVTSGYAEVTAESCTILSEHLQNLADISPRDAEDALAHAVRVLEHATNDHDRKKAQTLVDAASALFDAVKH